MSKEDGLAVQSVIPGFSPCQELHTNFLVLLEDFPEPEFYVEMMPVAAFLSK